MSRNKFCDALAKHIFTYRAENRETIAQFAEGCGVNTAIIQRIEDGDSSITLDTVCKICAYTNVDVKDFLFSFVFGDSVERKNELPESKGIVPFPQEETEKKTIRFSEILADIPPDKVLAELFRDPSWPQGSTVKHRGLEVLKLRLEGLDTDQVMERLHMTYYQVDNLLRETMRRLMRYMPKNIEVDLPSLRKILGIRPFNFTGSYTKLSELLQDMPSDEVLFQLDRERGNLTGGKKRHRINNQDLYILQQRLAGHTYRRIGEEFGKNPQLIRRWIWKTKVGLVRYLGVGLDVPDLFG